MDPITDVVLAGTAAIIGTEQIIPSLVSFVDALAGFFGETGTQAIFDGIEALGETNIRSLIPNMIINEDGMITGFNSNFIQSGNAAKLASSLNKIGGVMLSKGVDFTSDAGKEILASTFEKIKEYGPSLSSAALGTYIGNEIAQYAKNQTDNITDKIKDRFADRQSLIFP